MSIFDSVKNMSCGYNVNNIEQILLVVNELNDHEKIKHRGKITLIPFIRNNILGLRLDFIYNNNNNNNNNNDNQDDENNKCECHLYKLNPMTCDLCFGQDYFGNNSNTDPDQSEFYNIVYKPLSKFFSVKNGSLRHPSD